MATPRDAHLVDLHNELRAGTCGSLAHPLYCIAMNPHDVAPLESALGEIAEGRIAVVIDDDGHGVLMQVAKAITQEDVVFMVGEGGGIVSLALPARRCGELELERQSPNRCADSGRRMAILIEAREGTTTGISAAERAHTVRVAANPACRPGDLVRPGHILPLLTDDNGVLDHRGQAEAALDLARLASGAQAAAVCAILDDEGAAASAEFSRALAERHRLPVFTITEIVSLRYLRERPLRPHARERLVTHHGDFSAVTFRDAFSGDTHLALVRGVVEGRECVPVRLHGVSASASACDDLLAGLSRDRAEPLELALKRFARSGSGVLVHLGRHDPADPAAVDIAAQVLAEIGPATILLLNPEPEIERGLGERGIVLARRPGHPLRAVEEPPPAAALAGAGSFDVAI